LRPLSSNVRPPNLYAQPPLASVAQTPGIQRACSASEARM
jgi:hypothetical protein